ncbi:MAG TPA: hypothetical protein VHY20_07255 [Pirellulales bacterium]|nr:hypothetical protein [Pirellulales bacterium]
MLHAVSYLAAALVASLALCGDLAAAAPRVEMVLVNSAGMPTGTREWYQTLVDAKVDSLQIRQATGAEKPSIDVGGTTADPIYRVTGLLMPNNELVLPGGRLSSRDRSGVAKWLTLLKTEGPARAQGGKRLPFGLSQEQLVQVSADLARSVDLSTQGAAPRQVLERLGQQLKYPLLATSGVAQGLGSEPLADEFKGVSAGTVLACLLKEHDLVLVPQLDAQRQPQYMLGRAADSRESWPIGWPLKKAEREVVPGMFELINVELEDIPLSQLLSVISERLKLPVLIDRAKLQAQNIDLKKQRVSLPAGQSMYAIVLRKTLFTARLKYELKQDDAERPVLWITTTIPSK